MVECIVRQDSSESFDEYRVASTNTALANRGLRSPGENQNEIVAL